MCRRAVGPIGLFFVKKWSPIKPTHEKTNSFLLCMVLQSYSHDCFSKISRTLFDFINNTYWVFFFWRNSSLIFRIGVSCFSVALSYSTLFCCGGKANLVRFTLFYSTLLAFTHRLTDSQTDRGTNSLASRGLEEPAHVLRGLEEPFFQLCCCVSFGSGGK